MILSEFLLAFKNDKTQLQARLVLMWQIKRQLDSIKQNNFKFWLECILIFIMIKVKRLEIVKD
ncbi:hypothetical protein HFN_0742 [Helicobacter fennelliae MRY12-0050]|uniref:Uncharacterized protein n=1 Tax=Helicobacter fennelliae MRY12-0050 TaxID=1325130 RepID=T1DWL0_9HELI|nr:hypothetical protein HFN_0742 [Helicobacter fennelliae MRY12-0050]